MGYLSSLHAPTDREWLCRFEPKIQRTDHCWNWTAATDRGYGRFGINGRTYYAHRVAYELWVGPLTDGLTIDHLCRNRSCVNPAHLEEVTNRVNQLRGTSPMAKNARKTVCPQGHPLSGENLYVAPRTGNRQCLACRDAYRDRVRGGPAGRPNPWLSIEDVAAIRARYRAGGVKQSELADEYGVSQVHVSRIVRGDVWQA